MGGLFYIVYMSLITNSQVPIPFNPILSVEGADCQIFVIVSTVATASSLP